MRLGIFAKTFQRPEVEGVFEAVKAQGLDCVQFNMVCAGLPSMPDEIPPGLVARIHTAARNSGVEIAALSGTYNMIHPDPQVRANGLRRLRVLAGACQELGAGVITLCSGTRDPQDMWRRHPGNEAPEAWSDLLKELGAALRIAEDAGLTLAFEPEQGNVVSSARRGRALLDELRSPRLKVIMDAANLIEPGGDQKQILEEAFDLLGDEIIIVHAKDRTAGGGFCAAGQGILDFRYYLDLLRAHAYRGPLILHGLDESEVGASLRSLRAIPG